MTERIREFTDLYPVTGPDAGTGPRSRAEWAILCECGHLRAAHHQLGACMVLDGRGGYCRCLDYWEDSFDDPDAL